MNPAAIIIINLALLFYSIGVWSERIQGRLKVWHTVLLVRKDEKMIANFHKFSIAVWFIWLIPYLSPMLFGMIEAGK